LLSQRQPSRDLLAVIFECSRSLTAELSTDERCRRILEAASRVMPLDAICVLRLEGDRLIPIAMTGLDDSVLERSFDRSQHPRLDIILRSTSPLRFRPDAPVADPFENYMSASPGTTSRIHACVGVPLIVSGDPVGAITFDAFDAAAFAQTDDILFSILAATCGAALKMGSLTASLEEMTQKRLSVVSELRKNADDNVGGVMIGQSSSMRRVTEDIRVVAPSTLPVLITGETGVGKELVARRVHAYSDRSDGPLVQVNCAALPRSIAESELFGHVKGSFTGATADRLGKFEVADGGTLFLDEVGELAPDLQAQLLRVLQSGEIQRVGTDKLIRVDVRVVSATNRDLQSEVHEGRFRADLFHRLAAFPIGVPSLRERRDDIPLLLSHFLKRARQRLGLGPIRVSKSATQQLQKESWPGNIRELENVIDRGVLRASRASSSTDLLVVRPEHLDLDRSPSNTAHVIAYGPPSSLPNDLSFRERCDACKHERIDVALGRNDGNWAGAARDLGMHRSNLHRLAVRLGFKEKSDPA
jgi:anaerobic nitric oxide reductase transcription regulator